MSIEVNPDEPFHIVREGHVMALSLDELNGAYQRDQIAEDTLIWQEGLVEWMRLDTLLHTLETQAGPVAPVPPVSEETYYVLVAPGEVKQMSLDLLADAYRLDVIDDDTLVWQPGYTEWIPLSALLGPEESHVSIAPSMPPSYATPAAFSPAPLATPAFLHNAFDDSLAPVANWTIPEQRKASPWYARSLVALAALGALFVSYRAGAVESTAVDLEQSMLLASLESKVGEPGLDTVSGLTRWLHQLNAAHGLDSLASTDPIPKSATQSVAAGQSNSGESNDEKLPAADPKGETTEPTPQEVAAKPAQEQGLPLATSKGPPEKSAAAFSSSLSGKPSGKPAPVSQPVKRPASQAKWKGPSGSPYDPMDGTL